MYNSLEDVDYYKKQTRIVLKNCGLIDPENIDDYLLVDGYKALAKALFEMTPDQVVDEVVKSGLRGRGGAGFPTGEKWKSGALVKGDQKYIICNADEGDPGAFMDRSVLEGDPHSVLEAMALAGFSVGANKGFIYVRAEYPIAVKRLQIAIDQAKSKGLLGDNILGTDFSFDIELRLGAGAFVCGEAKALIASIEGKRGMPMPKNPRTIEKGLFEKPTVLNNVETFANIPQIILKGSLWYSQWGTEKSKGTKVFALGGKIKRTGLVEIPIGTPLRDIIFDIGGGIPNGKKYKAVQTGGPSGGCIPMEHIDVKIDYESLTSIGSMMGSGGMIVMDEDNCMVDIARFFLDFSVDESCGKCTPCRDGTKKMLAILEKIIDGKGELEDLDRLENLGNVIKQTSLCGLGKTAPNPVLSTMKYFREEYISHVVDKKCLAGVCKSLYEIVISDKCIGCTKCVKVCPVNAISGTLKSKHVIDTKACIKCEACIGVCPVKAISKS
jgi:NADH-quinone oxidoreductase subunit F/NADP-reducing hydrogenase subunit HndC